MADGELFAADQYGLFRGGAETGNIAAIGESVGKSYADQTTLNLDRLPWGTGKPAREFEENYLPAHRQILSAVKSIHDALKNIGLAVETSAKDFNASQQDATDAIKGQGGTA